MARQARITGSGISVPPRVVTNHDLAKLMDTSDEWIVQRTGIRERRHVDDGMVPSDLGVEACERALQAAGRSASDIDLLIVGTLSPEHFFPGTAFFMQRRLQLGHTPVIDLRNQCTGFLVGLELARTMIESGRYQRALVCGVEIHSRAIDISNRGRDMAVLFGDGAGAVVVEADQNPERGILATKMYADGRHAERLWVEAPMVAHNPYVTASMLEEGRHFPKMDGKHVFKHAVQYLPAVIKEVLEPLHLTPREVDKWLFHQANLRINEHVAQSMGIAPERAPYNIDRYGNCSAASIPMLLAECMADGRVKTGDLVCMAAFGSGYTWASALVRF